MFKRQRCCFSRPSEIVDGNAKMTLGMIWTIILRFAIQDISVEGNVYLSDLSNTSYSAQNSPTQQLSSC